MTLIRKAVVADIESIYHFELQYFVELEPDYLELWKKSKVKSVQHIKNKLDHTFVAVEDYTIKGFISWAISAGKGCIESIYTRSEKVFG